MIFTEKEERDGKTHFYPKIPASGAGGANGVMLDSSLSVKKTVTATGVKAPTITGGSSGGGVTAKIKNGAFDGNTAGSYTFVGTVKIPEGYAYSNGTLTAKATITVVANNATKKQLPTDTIVQYGRIESYTEIDKEIKADST